MLFNFINQKIVTFVVLVITFLLSAATSIPHENFNSGTLNVSSDCVSGNLEETVDVSNYTIINPSNLSFLDFGFPVAKISPDNEMSGTVNGALRVCKRILGGKLQDKEMVFSCEDNGTYFCSIVIQAL
jgi:hypothetical protein